MGVKTPNWIPLVVAGADPTLLRGQLEHGLACEWCPCAVCDKSNFHTQNVLKNADRANGKNALHKLVLT
jgi:hypothetical protein